MKGCRKFVVCIGLGMLAAGADAQSQDQMQKLASLGVNLAGSNARIASDVCQIDKARIDAYKEASHKQFANDANFAVDWAAGWQKAQVTVTGYAQMKNRDPAGYERQKAATCSDLEKKLG
ncbi:MULTISPECIES: hypothetical protein [Burkholderia]|uniref:hypothetical protein n=1 Tax=Burkholderia TaxID=32008 RepID=UPI000C004612|nr:MULTISPECIES: hypothetical protein [Burkholderia]PFH20994.1 hypothetical protein BX604_5419 [Burkholderia sp. JKS000303]